jgi:hypothetical protein
MASHYRFSRSFMDAFQIPRENVIGHREVFLKLGVPDEKSCPGNCWNMELFRAEL